MKVQLLPVLMDELGQRDGTYGKEHFFFNCMARLVQNVTIRERVK